VWSSDPGAPFSGFLLNRLYKKSPVIHPNPVALADLHRRGQRNATSRRRLWSDASGNSPITGYGNFENARRAPGPASWVGDCLPSSPITLKLRATAELRSLDDQIMATPKSQSAGAIDASRRRNLTHTRRERVAQTAADALLPFEAVSVSLSDEKPQPVPRHGPDCENREGLLLGRRSPIGERDFSQF
jgi:hypothetical protein